MRIVYAIVSLFIASSTLVPAQDSLHITLADAVRLATSDASAIRRAANLLRASEQRVALARGTFDPDLRLQASPSVRYAPGGAAAPGSDGRSSGDKAQSSLSLSAVSNLTLFDGAARTSALEAVEHEAEASRLSLQRARQEVAMQATSAFVDAMIARELIALERENLVAETRQAERVEAFVEAGARPRSERFTQSAMVASAELRLLSAERAHELALMRLALVLGREASQALSLIPPEPPRVRDATAPGINLAARSDLRALGERVAASQQLVDQADAGNAVSVGVTGAVGSSWLSTASAGAGDQIGRDNPAASVGVSITLPLFDRGRSSAETELARIELDERSRALADLRREAAAQEREALLVHETAVKRLSVAERQLEAARLALEAEEARYQSGSSTLAELALVRARYLVAATQRVQSAYELIEADTRVSFAQGTLDVSLQNGR